MAAVIEQKRMKTSYSLLGALPCLGFGMVSLIFHYDSLMPVRYSWLYASLVFEGLLLAGLLAGGLANFPRWAYSYLVWVLTMTWSLSDLRVHGSITLDWRMWLLPLGALLLAALLRRSLQQLRGLFGGLWREGTLFSLGIFSFYAWAFMSYDSNHHPYLWAFIIITALTAAVGAWLYFYLASPLARALVLAAGMLAIMGIDKISNATWDFHAYYNLPKGEASFNPLGLLMLLVLLGVMILPGWLSWRRNKKLADQVG